jgi:hypothetical protein
MMIAGALVQYELENRVPNGSKISLTNLVGYFIKGGKIPSCPLGGTYATVLTVGVSSEPGVTLCSLGGMEEHVRIVVKAERAEWLTQLAKIAAVAIGVMATVFSVLFLKKRKSTQAQ